MNLNSTLANFVAHLNNAVKVKKTNESLVPATKLCFSILKKLKSMGFIGKLEETEAVRDGLKVYRVELSVLKIAFLREIKLKSKPGRRIYVGHKLIDKQKGNCFHKAILTTSHGVLSCDECKRLKIGGEVLVILK